MGAIGWDLPPPVPLTFQSASPFNRGEPHPNRNSLPTETSAVLSCGLRVEDQRAVPDRDSVSRRPPKPFAGWIPAPQSARECAHRRTATILSPELLNIQSLPVFCRHMRYYIRQHPTAEIEGPFTVSDLSVGVASGRISPDSLASSDVGDTAENLRASSRCDWFSLSELGEFKHLPASTQIASLRGFSGKGPTQLILGINFLSALIVGLLLLIGPPMGESETTEWDVLASLAFPVWVLSAVLYIVRLMLTESVPTKSSVGDEEKR